MDMLVLDGDLVVNVIVTNDEDFEIDGYELVPRPDGPVAIGWTRAGETWDPPDQPPPPTLAELQAQLDEIAAQIAALQA